MRDEGAETVKFSWARMGCAAMRNEGAESSDLVGARKSCAAMRDEGAESVRFSWGSKELCRNAG